MQATGGRGLSALPPTPHPTQAPVSSSTCPRSLFIEHKLCPRYQTQNWTEDTPNLSEVSRGRRPPSIPSTIPRLEAPEDLCLAAPVSSHHLQQFSTHTAARSCVTQPRGHTTPASLPGNLRAHCVHLKQGDRWTDMFLWRFSKRLYFRM